MATAAVEKNAAELLEALDQLFGLHPGFRAVHAKGAICSGLFTPTAAAGELTRAPHAHRASTPVHVRLSDFAGVPVVPDNDAEGASPRGIAVRFNLVPHVHMDLVGHSADGFPVRTGEGFLDFARAHPAFCRQRVSVGGGGGEKISRFFVRRVEGTARKRSGGIRHLCAVGGGGVSH